MQLETLDRNVTSSGIAQQKKMGINMDGTAFRILSDGLYSDKIGSMVRETASNALDAHIAASKPDVPIKIGLPNSLDMTWTVIDEGIGLDAEEVLEVATTYFSSTKRTSNTAIGGFGLGFKSPFAVSDQWSITATKDGVCRTFSAYMDDSGEPTVALLTEDKTDAPNGVRIDVPVKRSQISDYTDAVRNQLQFFDPRPAIIRGAVEWPEDVDQMFHVKGEFSFSPSTAWSNESNWLAVCGPVAFKIDFQQIRGSLTSEAINLMSACRGLLKFNIGDVVPAPSRESLQYNQRTIQAICKKLNAAVNYARKHAAESLANAPTYFEACSAFASLSYNRFFSEICKGAKWNGREINNVIRPVLSDGSSAAGRMYQISNYDLSKQRIALSNDYPVAFRPATDYVLFIDDLPNPQHRQGVRIKQYMSTSPLDNAVVLRDCKCLDKILELIDGFPEDQIVYLSTIEPPQVNRTAAPKVGDRSLPGIRKVDRQGYIPRSCSSKGDVSVFARLLNEDEEIEPAYYIVTEHNYISPVTLCRLRERTLFPGSVYVVPKSLESRISKEDGWLCFKSYCDDISEKLKDEMLSRIEAHVRSNSANTTFREIFSKMESLGIKPPQRCVKAFWSLYRDWFNNRRPDKPALASNAVDALGLQKDKEKLYLSIELEFKELQDRLSEQSTVAYWAIRSVPYKYIDDNFVKSLIKSL